MRAALLIMVPVIILGPGCRTDSNLVADEMQEETVRKNENMVARELLVRDHQWQNSPGSPAEMFSLVFYEETAQILRPLLTGGPRNYMRWETTGDSLLFWEQAASQLPDECFRIAYSPQLTDFDTSTACTRDTLLIAPCSENEWDTLVYNCMPGM